MHGVGCRTVLGQEWIYQLDIDNSVLGAALFVAEESSELVSGFTAIRHTPLNPLNMR